MGAGEELAARVTATVARVADADLNERSRTKAIKDGLLLVIEALKMNPSAEVVTEAVTRMEAIIAASDATEPPAPIVVPPVEPEPPVEPPIGGEPPPTEFSRRGR